MRRPASAQVLQGSVVAGGPRAVGCVAVVGLGYVGLQLAAAFGRVLPTIGFDVDPARVQALRAGNDRNGEVSADALRTHGLRLTDDPGALVRADFFIVAVPTPVDDANRPHLDHLTAASRLIAETLKVRCEQPPRRRPPTVVYESTVFPGCTEDVCVPILEQASGFRAGRDFFVGYSPERINPGDGEHTLADVVKVVAGQNEETTEVMATVYGLIARAGTCRAPSIQVAEAAKVIENIQRDLNIALMNELALLFHRLGLATQDVLRVARTKWNFLPFEPGLVGGHCIPVDPYYLTHRAEQVGYHPDVILAGRRINDAMGRYVARETVRLLIQAGTAVRGAAVLVLGVAFKENVRDVRNSRVIDLIRELEQYGVGVVVHDPMLDAGDLRALGLREVPNPFARRERYDAVVLAVPHRAFREQSPQAYRALLRRGEGPGVLVDVRGVLRQSIAGDDLLYWSL